ncbi:MAG: hypothetical protein QOD99_948 [Chthoniobacter sp.]|jgi:hypothetical protein|nr:hypothetical protein [Chthoniobacter sp.]
MRLLFAAASALLFAGCAGYHIGPIKPQFMHDVNTLAVSNFKNDTLEPRIEVLVADTVIKQIQQDGTYRITTPDKADAILEGTITNIKRRASRSVRGNVLATSEFTLDLELTFSMKRRDGTRIRSQSIDGHTSFFVGGDVNQDERQAIPLAAQDAAVRLVSQISEGW